jgi:hypothetical protein
LGCYERGKYNEVVLRLADGGQLVRRRRQGTPAGEQAVERRLTCKGTTCSIVAVEPDCVLSAACVLLTASMPWCHFTADTVLLLCAGLLLLACLQERLELLEHENDLLVRQQNELDRELQRLSGQLAERDQQVRLRH